MQPECIECLHAPAQVYVVVALVIATGSWLTQKLPLSSKLLVVWLAAVGLVHVIIYTRLSTAINYWTHTAMLLSYMWVLARLFAEHMTAGIATRIGPPELPPESSE